MEQFESMLSDVDIFLLHRLENIVFQSFLVVVKERPLRQGRCC